MEWTGQWRALADPPEEGPLRQRPDRTAAASYPVIHPHHPLGQPPVHGEQTGQTSLSFCLTKGLV